MAQNLATTPDAPARVPTDITRPDAPAFDIVAELNGVVLHPDSTRFDRYVALNALHRIALGINARLDADSERRKRVRDQQRADYVRASRKLAACTRLISGTGRINQTEAEILAEVVAHDHAEAFDMDAARIDFTRLNPAQADGLACVRCGVDYLLVAVPHRPVGRSAIGSQVFTCSWTCAGGAA